jgi:ribosomal protein S18 acetylase RimI-like enzyme
MPGSGRNRTGGAVDEVAIRPAVAEDGEAVAACSRAAYATYVERLGREPAPMGADYAALIARGHVWVADARGAVRGVLVLEPGVNRDYLLVWSVAAPVFQGRGLCRRLLAFAEAEAARRGMAEVRLFTNELMTENLAFYTRLGYEETERRQEGPHRRVYLRKGL